jgi:hypothetical protein
MCLAKINVAYDSETVESTNLTVAGSRKQPTRLNKSPTIQVIRKAIESPSVDFCL